MRRERERERKRQIYGVNSLPNSLGASFSSLGVLAIEAATKRHVQSPPRQGMQPRHRCIILNHNFSQGNYIRGADSWGHLMNSPRIWWKCTFALSIEESCLMKPSIPFDRMKVGTKTTGDREFRKEFSSVVQSRFFLSESPIGNHLS